MMLLRYDELAAMPWKNGGGTTRELACEPPGAVLDAFAWRVSIADVAASGPFSHFPGIERVIMLLDGEGMTLNIGGDRAHDLTAPLTPFRFAGEDAVDARLAGGACRDFNLMMRRGRVDGGIDVWRTDADVDAADGHVLFHCAGGRWEIGGTAIAAGDTLRADAPRSLALRMHAPGALIGVRIVPCKEAS